MKNAIVLVCVSLLAACAKPTATPADTIYTNAKIYRVNADNEWGEAMAVTDGKIAAIGDNAAVMQHAGSDTQVIDLGGRFVMPGIHDTHIHPSEAGVQQLLECSFLSYDMDEVLDILRGCIEETPKGEWVRGGQWNDGLFTTDKDPKTILDEIAPDHPVFLMDWSVHNAWVNSKALELFGIDDDTPDPSGGIIVRNPQTGEATGILLDNAAYDQQRKLPTYALDDRTEALRWSLDNIAGYGVTTIKEAIVTREYLETYASLETESALPVRVNTSLTWKSAWADSHEDEIALLNERESHVSRMVDTNFAKIMLDGIPPTYTAAMLEPYVPSDAFGDSWTGKLMFEPDVLTDDVVHLDRQGISIKIHATGDRSAREALDAFEAARKANGDNGVIHEVSHAELIHPDDIERFAQLNVAAEMCPILWHPIPGLDWEAWLGPDRQVWPVRALVEADALVIYGSDWPVVPTPNPWPGIEAMVTRADPAGGSDETLWAEQAIDLATAIRIFTINGAEANGMLDQSGSLDTGKDADFIVLDRNIMTIPIADVGETKVVYSVVGGRAVVNEL